ncbi:MAG: NHL repeat-containing protein [Thermoleophilia bacterium]|nr:NHL repeat-containing protein [Thermoleophilia bacterium]
MNTFPLRRFATLVTTTAALIGCMLVLPSLSAAADTYALTASGCASSSWGSGGSDEAGTIYSACDATVVRYDKNGVLLPNLVLPGATTDVAPSPDGSMIYVFQGDTVVRYNKVVATNTYTKDLAWTIASFTFDGVVWPVRGRGIAVDAWGDLYISNGAWYNSQANVVAKFRANGSFVTAFGGWGNGVGEFNVNMGLAVTRDGRTIYVTEQTNGRVQRFDYNNGQYSYTLTFGSTNVNCIGGSTLSAPYDLGVDPWGFVYVMDTSCQRVKKFTANGTYIDVVASHATKIAHGIAVGRHGEFYVGQWGQLFSRTAANPEPGAVPAITPLPAPTPPDAVAPVLTGTTVPLTTTTQTITVGITATDNVAVTSMRFANEDGAFGAWINIAATGTQTLTAGYGVKGVNVQVKDAAGNLSNMIYKTLSYAAVPPPAPDNIAPVLTAITVPATTTTQTIAVDITATDNKVVTQVRFANEDGNWGAWIAYAATVNTTLTAGYGPKGVTAQVRDAAGNESGTIYRTTTFQSGVVVPPPANDIADPVLTAATIPTLTNNQTIAVATTATDDTGVTRMRFATEDGNWKAWQPYAASKNFVLSANYGPKLVFVQVGDAYARESGIIQLRTSYQADAVLPPPGGQPDATAPVLTAATVPATSTTQAITIGITATDNVAVAQVRFANEDGNWAGWQTYTPNMAWTLSAGYTLKLVFIQVRDAAGNESTVLQKRSQLTLVAPPVNPGPVDAADPVLTTVTVPTPATTRAINVGIVATDDVAVTEVRFANEDGNWTAWQPFAATKTWTLSAGNLNKLVFTQVRDASGKESNVIMSKTLLNAPNNGA